jgi:hypothetical protein
VAYEGPEYWYVIYKAIGDFGGLMRDAAEAKAALQGMSDAVKSETAAEVAGSTQAAAARAKDTQAIQQQVQGLQQLANAAKQTNTQLLYGGRNDETAHLSDLAQELNYTTLLNRQKWLGFSSVQQAMSYRQQMYNLQLLENRAHFAGYQTADQYLGFLQREISDTAALSAVIRTRTAAVLGETGALLAHSNALQGTHQSAGQLGEQLTTATAFAAAVSGIPSTATTHVVFADAAAMAELAAYRAALLSLPHAESTDIVAAATRLGGVPLTQRQPLAIEAVPRFSNLDSLRGLHERVPVTVTSTVAGPSEPLRFPGADAGAAGQVRLPGDIAEAAEETDALGEAMSLLHARSAISIDSLREFGNSAMLAAVDARALEQGVGRLDAAWQMMREVKPRSDDWFQLFSISRAVQNRDISSAATGYPRAAPGMGELQDVTVRLHVQDGDQAEALLGRVISDEEYLDGLTAHPHLELDGAQEALDDGELFAEMMHEFGDLHVRPEVDPSEIEAATEDAYHLDGVLIGLSYERADPEVDVQGISRADDEIRAMTEELYGVPDEVDTVIVVESSGAASEIRDYTRDIQDIEREVGTRADFEDDDAETGLSRYLSALMEAIARRYDFYVGLDDTAAQEELASWMRDLEAAQAAERAVTAGMGGASGGGGGGGPPVPPSAPPGDGGDEEDAEFWKALGDAIHDTDGKLRAFEDDARGIGNALPHPDDAEAWEELAGAERDAGLRAADAVSQLQQMAQAAAAAGKAADAAKYAWAAATLQAAALKAQGTAAADDVAQLAELAASADKVGDSSRAAYTAQKLLSSGFEGIDDPAAKAAANLELTTASASRAYGWWGLLTKQVTLWSGVMGDTHLIGQVQLWHILLDGIVEILALWVPALVTAGAGLAGWAAAAYQSGKEVYQQWESLNTVSKALNTTIPPLADNFQKLQDAVRPQVYQLLGDYLDVAGGKTGAFTQLILQTGNYLDRFAAKIVVDMESGGNGLKNFFDSGIKDLTLIGQGFDSLGVIFAKFLQATAISHVAEDLATVGDLILKVVADLVSLVPAPVLAVVLGLHAFVLWGGLAFDVVGKVVIAVATLAGKFSALNDVAQIVARSLNATDEQLANIAKSSAAVGAVSDVLGAKTSEAELGQLSVAIQNTGKTLEEFVTSAGPTSAARLEQFAGGLDNAGRETVALGIAAGATDGQLAGLSAKLSGVAADGEEAAVAVGSSGGGFMATLGKLVPFLSNAYVDLGLLAVALAGVYAYLGTRADQTKQFTDAIGQAVQKASLLTVVGTTMNNLAEVTTALGTAQKTGVGNASELAASQSDLSGKLQEELTHVGDVSKAYGTDFVGSLNLLQAAGVSTTQLFSDQNKTWAVAMQMVRGLVDGYAAMGQQLGTVGSDLNVLNLQNSKQVSSMAQLNSAYDAFTKTVGAAPSAFITMAQGFTQFDTDAKAAGATMTGLSGASLTLQNDFQTNYNNVEQFFDAFRNDQALTGQGDFTAFVKDAVASLIPMAGGSKEAAAQISALAQEAGGPATDSIKTLQQWVGNIKNPLQAMYTASQNAAIGASNLSQDAARLTNTLQGLLNPAMAQAIFNADGGQQLFNTFADTLKKLGPTSKDTVFAASNIITQLKAITGSSSSAKSQFIGFTEAMGLSAKQSDTLWSVAGKNITANLGQVRSSMAANATQQADLVKPGETDTMLKSFKDGTFYEATFLAWIPQVQRGLNIMNHDIGQFFVHDLPVAAQATAHAFEAAWDGAVNWFTQSVPHGLGVAWATVSGAMKGAWGGMTSWFTQSVPHAFQTAWAYTWRDAVTPVSHALSDVTAWVARNFDPWWATHGAALEKLWNNLWGFLKATAQDTYRFVLDVSKVFWESLVGIFTSGPMKQIWHFFAAQASQAWALTRAGFTQMWNGLVSVATSFGSLVWKGTREAGAQAWQWLKTAGVGIWQTIEAAAKVLFTFIENISKTAADVLAVAFKGAWATVVAIGKLAWDTLVLIINVIIDGLAGHWHQMWLDVQAWGLQVWNTLGQFFATTFHAIAALAVQLWHIWFAPAWASFYASVGAPLTHFFTSTVPGWFDSVRSWWDNTWAANVKSFNSTILAPLEHFFTGDIPGWWDDLVSGGGKAWDSVWSGFSKSVLGPLTTFFTGTVPKWWSDFTSFGAKAWTDTWNGFVRDLIDPIVNFFTVTLPNAITGGIANALSSLAGPINSALSAVKSALSFIPGLAAGGPVGMAAGGWVRMAAGTAMRMGSGSVPGTGDEDGTRIVAMGGEFMIRKSARMALQAAYGPQFLDWLNMADVWLGAGSRGNQASQKRGMGAYGAVAGGGAVMPGLSDVAGMFGGGMAAGGLVANLFVPGLSPNLSRQLSAATAGQLPRTLSTAAGNRVGLQVDSLTINNPVAEKPSDSITRSSNRLAFLAGRGVI